MIGVSMRRHFFFPVLCAISLTCCLNACGDSDSNNGGEQQNQQNKCDPAQFVPSCEDASTQKICNADGTPGTKPCTNGCDAATGKCRETVDGSKCNPAQFVPSCEDASTQKICNADGTPGTKPCTNGCDAATGKCRVVEEGCVEDTYSCEDNTLYYCYEGSLMDLVPCGEMKCRADLGGCYDMSVTCKSGYTGCDEEYEDIVWACVEGHWLYAPENECDLGEICTEKSGEGAVCVPACKERCTYDGLSRITCSEFGEAIEEPCALGCVNGECIDDTCQPDTFVKDCRTPRQKRVCTDGKVSFVACGDNEMCADGECRPADRTDVCDWSGSSCSADKHYTQNCVDGTASGEKCADGFFCNMVGGTATCVAAFSGDVIEDGVACTDNFIPFCNAQNQTVKCSNNKLSVVNCGKKLCEVSYGADVSVTCRAYTGAEKLSIGDKCNTSDTENGTTFCYDNDIPVQCNNKGYLNPVDEKYRQGCKKLGQICAVSDADGIEGVKVAGCYDPCFVEGSESHVCGTMNGGETVYTLTHTCLDLGDGQLGLDSGYNHSVCDVTCVAGECVDYTEEIPNAGEACDPGKIDSYCLNDTMLVECREVVKDSGVTVIAGEKCYAYEKCTTVNDVPKCRMTCNAGDPDRTVCETMLMNDFAVSQKCTAVGDGSYVYVDAKWGEEGWTKCSSGCTSGKCDD